MGSCLSSSSSCFLHSSANRVSVGVGVGVGGLGPVMLAKPGGRGRGRISSISRDQHVSNMEVVTGFPMIFLSLHYRGLASASKKLAHRRLVNSVAVDVIFLHKSRDRKSVV